jgi:hypothetical protein
MSEVNQGQQQENAAPVSELDQIADILVGGLDEDFVSDDANDDESPLVDSNDSEEVEQGQEEQDTDVSWASALGLSDEDIVLDEEGNFKGVKIGDEQIGLSELKNGYQFNKANTQRAQQLAEERKQLEQVKEVVTKEYTTKLQNVNKLTELLAGKFLDEYNSIDWNRLRAEKPGEYAALLRDYDARKAELQGVFSALETENSSITASQMQEQQAKFMQHLEVQAKMAIERNPEWQDVEKFKSAMSDMTKFVGEAYGFSQQEFESVYDARLLDLIKDAMAYRNGTKIAQQKIVNKVPTFQKSGVQAKKTTKLDALVKKAKTAKGYQKKGAEVDAVAALRLGVK